MRVGEAGHDGAAAQIHHPAPGRLQVTHFGVAADSKHAIAGNRDRLGARLGSVHRVDGAVDQDQISFHGVHLAFSEDRERTAAKSRSWAAIAIITNSVWRERMALHETTAVLEGPVTWLECLIAGLVLCTTGGG